MMHRYKILTLGIIALAFGFVLGASYFSLTPLTSSEGNEEGELSVKYHAVQCVYLKRAGESEYTLWDCNPNLFVTAGKSATSDYLSLSNRSASVAGGPFDDIAVANVTGACGAQLYTDTTLCGEYTVCGMGRTAVANTFLRLNSTAANQGNWTVGGEFTANAACDVNGTGLLNATSAGTLFAENTFTTASLAANDKINITWFIWVT